MSNNNSQTHKYKIIINYIGMEELPYRYVLVGITHQFNIKEKTNLNVRGFGVLSPTVGCNQADD